RDTKRTRRPLRPPARTDLPLPTLLAHQKKSARKTRLLAVRDVWGLRNGLQRRLLETRRLNATQRIFLRTDGSFLCRASNRVSDLRHDQEERTSVYDRFCPCGPHDVSGPDLVL